MVLEDLRMNPFALPPSTQVTVEYENLKNCDQHAKVNFKPTKRTFKRVPSAQENEWALKKILKAYWGFDEFRDRQLEICIEVMKGNDVFVNAPTGLGKSVCFQVPAITAEHGITVVIVPLIALMQDQILGLQEKGIKAASLCSSTPPHMVTAIKKELCMGHPRLRLLYTTPETLFGAKYESYFQKCYQQGQLVRMVVDEAHVIDDWGWAFRPEFRHLGKFRQKFPDVPISAFTASARSETRDHICRVLEIKKGSYAQFVFPVNRKNLFYEVKHRGHEDDEVKVLDVIQTIKSVQAETVKRGRLPGVGIIYCTYVETCKLVCEKLRKSGIPADLYHAKMCDIEKEQVQEAFKSGKVKCIVATIAFGMGIDKSDVRYVIHFQCPSGMEPYYQETGRAGRDGHMARCILYYSREDAKSRGSMVYKTARETVTKCTAKGEQELGEDFARRYTNSFKSLQTFAESTTRCRHVALARYFEESNIDESNGKHLEAYCNKMCDICANNAAVRRRATNITEDMPVASQVIPRAARAETEEPAEEEPVAVSSFSASMLEMHGSDLNPSSAVAGPSAAPRPATPQRLLPNTGMASVSSSFVPTPLAQTRVATTVATTRIANPPQTPLLNSDRKSKRAMTIQDVAGEGSFAVPDDPPSSKKKRKEQHDTFLATEAAQGDGPYGYYGAASTSRPRSQLQPSSFKTPFRKEPPRHSNVEISAERRAEGLAHIVEAIKQVTLEGELADSVWQHWRPHRNESRGRRRKIINKVAQGYEAELAQTSGHMIGYNNHLELMTKVLRMLSTAKAVEALVSGDLKKDHGERDEVKILLDLGQRIGKYGD